MATALGKIPASLTDEQREQINAWLDSLHVDAPHMRQVTRLALRLFDELKAMHRLRPRVRVLLEAGALLHDVGFSVSENRHHKHSRDLILKNPVPGLPQEENLAVACLARYHRKAPPKPKHKEFSRLGKPMQRAVERLAAILRIADGLDRSHCASIRDLSCRRADQRVTILLETVGDAGLDLYAAQKKRALFEEVFATSVEFLVVGEIGSPHLD